MAKVLGNVSYERILPPMRRSTLSLQAEVMTLGKGPLKAADFFGDDGRDNSPIPLTTSAPRKSPVVFPFPSLLIFFLMAIWEA
jgi:hypothetical protein